MAEWQPITDAPLREGVLATDGRRVTLARRWSADGEWVDACDHSIWPQPFQPVLWMPLPAPPIAGG
jgi:hypothetical protein